MQLKVFGLMVELNNLRTLLKRSVLYLSTYQSNHLRLLNKYCLRGRFKKLLKKKKKLVYVSYTCLRVN